MHAKSHQQCIQFYMKVILSKPPVKIVVYRHIHAIRIGKHTSEKKIINNTTLKISK